MFSGDRPTQANDHLEDLGRQRFELGPVAWVGRIEERPRVKLALGGVRIEGPTHVVGLEDVLELL